jgi:hypothetical protein
MELYVADLSRVNPIAEVTPVSFPAPNDGNRSGIARPCVVKLLKMRVWTRCDFREK